MSRDARELDEEDHRLLRDWLCGDVDGDDPRIHSRREASESFRREWEELQELRSALTEDAEADGAGVLIGDVSSEGARAGAAPQGSPSGNPTGPSSRSSQRPSGRGPWPLLIGLAAAALMWVTVRLLDGTAPTPTVFLSPDSALRWHRELGRVEWPSGSWTPGTAEAEVTVRDGTSRELLFEPVTVDAATGHWESEILRVSTPPLHVVVRITAGPGQTLEIFEADFVDD